MNSRVVVTKDRRNHWLDMKNNRRGDKNPVKKKNDEKSKERFLEGVWENCLEILCVSLCGIFEEIEPKRNGVCSYRNI